MLLHDVEELYRDAQSKRYEGIRKKKQEERENRYRRKLNYGTKMEIEPLLIADIVEEQHQLMEKQREARKHSPTAPLSPLKSPENNNNPESISTEEIDCFSNVDTIRSIKKNALKKENVGQNVPRVSIRETPKPAKDRLSILKRREDIILEQQQKKLDQIEEKKQQALEKVALQELQTRQMGWSKLLFLAQATRYVFQ